MLTRLTSHITGKRPSTRSTFLLHQRVLCSDSTSPARLSAHRLRHPPGTGPAIPYVVFYEIEVRPTIRVRGDEGETRNISLGGRAARAARTLGVILIWEIAGNEHIKPVAIIRERGGAV